MTPQEQWEWRRLASDQKALAERKWINRTLARLEQKACDHGLFSDDDKQRELFTCTKL